LFTSVVAFGVSALVVALGVLFILVGVALMALAKRDRVIVEQPAPDPLAPPEVVAAQP
jgi:hypothetical protein